MRVVLISTYELGRQPFGLASPAAWLRQAGASVTCLDLAVERLDEEAVRAAGLVAFYLPMHTATRIATRVVARVKALNPTAHVCFYGLYAAMNERFLRGLGAGTVLGGEFEQGLVSLLQRLRSEPESVVQNVQRTCATQAGQPEPLVSLAKQRFLVPDRSGLPGLSNYARLNLGDGTSRTVGYAEASRGCKHLCRHCPIPPVYQGRFRIVQREVVLEDIRRQIEAGAEHITFGDPDFFNGIGHARALVRALHREHPHLTYDVTIKVEHLVRHAAELVLLRETGCRLVITAAESIDDRVLELLEKGHTRADFIEAVRLCREAGLNLQPTFVPFTPWSTIEGYRELLSLLAQLDLIEQVAPIQLAIRLLIPAGSRLLEVDEIRRKVGPFEERALVYPWRHEDPRVDRLQSRIQMLVQAGDGGSDRRATFSRIWRLAEAAAAGFPAAARDRAAQTIGVGIRGREELQATHHPRRSELEAALRRPPRAPIPYLTEPWYC